MNLANIPWQKPSACGDAGSCVEVAQVGGKAGIRDSKTGNTVALWPDEFRQLLSEIADETTAPFVWRWLESEGLTFDQAEKTTFINAVRAGEYDNLLGGAR